MITLNALTAADCVIIPVQAQYLPAKGMTQLLSTIAKVKKHANRNLTIDGILLTLLDGRTNPAKSTVEALRENFGCRIRICRTTIPIAVKAAEAASKDVSIYKYEPSSPVQRLTPISRRRCWPMAGRSAQQRSPRLFKYLQLKL